jgi:hypothetical protein
MVRLPRVPLLAEQERESDETGASEEQAEAENELEKADEAKRWEKYRRDNSTDKSSARRMV